MSFPRKPVRTKTKNDIELICLDWIECDETIYQTKDAEYYERMNNENNGSDEEMEDEPHNKVYNIFLFGVTQEGHSVCVNVKNYHPYFYIKIPDDWTDKFTKKFIKKNLENNYNNYELPKNHLNKYKETKLYESLQYIREKMSNFKEKTALIEDEISQEESEIFWSFTNNQKYKFLKLFFKSKAGFNLYQKFFKHNRYFPYHGKSRADKPIEMKLFESNFEPLLRFFHDKEIKPSDWVRIPKHKFKLRPGMSSCQINIEVDYQDVMPIEKNAIPPLIVASFDIEADSSHGDFPLPKKDYKKMANQLVICYLRDKYKLSKMNRSSEDYKKLQHSLKSPNYFGKRIIQSFTMNNTDQDIIVDEEISKIYIKDPSRYKQFFKELLSFSNPKFKNLITTILEICDRPIRKVIAKQKMKLAINQINIIFEKREEYLMDKYSKYATIKDLINVIEQVSRRTRISLQDLKDKILVKEVLVKFVNNQLKSIFPDVKGDRVIQIGTSFWRYGDDKPIYHNIVTLKNTDALENIDVSSFENETDLLLEWINIIRTFDPDIILGYNIFGFDERFLYDRALELMAKGDKKNKQFQRFINMGRLNYETYKNIWSCRGELIKKKLASSALGANFLEYFNMTGRVQIDLLKVIQAGLTKLDSYKLDSVAEFYISGSVTSQREIVSSQTNKTVFKVTNIKELDNGNYIILTLKSGEKYDNGRKLIIENVNYETNEIIINEAFPSNLIDKKPKWGISKDDITPKQIFEFQKGTDHQRGLIAKYCIQDCALVIRLLKKLDTIPNNFGMSNVCIVPFSFIFNIFNNQFTAIVIFLTRFQS